MSGGCDSLDANDEPKGIAVAGGAAYFTEHIDSRAGSIRARGRLTAQGVDLLSGTVLALHRGGHRRVLLDLADIQGADVAGLVMLRHLQTTIAAEGRSLVVLHSPTDGV